MRTATAIILLIALFDSASAFSKRCKPKHRTYESQHRTYESQNAGDATYLPPPNATYSTPDGHSMWRDFWRLTLDYDSKRYAPARWSRTLGGGNACAYFSGIPEPGYWQAARKASLRISTPLKHIASNFPIPCPDQPVPETVSRTMHYASPDEKYFGDLYLFMRELAGLPAVPFSSEYACAARSYANAISQGREALCHRYPHNLGIIDRSAKQRHDACLAGSAQKPAESLICGEYDNAWDALVVGWTGELNTHLTGHFKMHYAATNKRFGVAHNPRTGAWVAKFSGDWPEDAVRFLQQL